MGKNSEEFPKIDHIDTNCFDTNFYDPDTNTIILDEKLREYPKAYNHVLEHELKHFRIGVNALKQAWLDIKTSTMIAGSKSEEAEQFRDYLSEKTGANSLNWRERFSFMIANIISGTVCIFTMPLSFLQRKVREILKSWWEG